MNSVECAAGYPRDGLTKGPVARGMSRRLRLTHLGRRSAGRAAQYAGSDRVPVPVRIVSNLTNYLM